GPRMLRAIGRFLKTATDAWEWCSLLVLIGVVPGVPVVLGVLEGQSWSVLSLYGVAAAAFWVGIYPEAHAHVEILKRRRRRVRFYQDACCAVGPPLNVGVENTSRTTISDSLVYIDVGGTAHVGRVMFWAGM